MKARYLGDELLGCLGEPDVELLLKPTLHVQLLKAARFVPSCGLDTLGHQRITCII